MSDLYFPKTISVTGQEIDVSFLTQSQQEFYIQLFKDVLKIYSSTNKQRIIIGFAGPTGSGKSVIASLIDIFAKQVELPFKCYSLGIDAFHFTNDYLESHTDTQGTLLKNVKGRFDTYDVLKLVSTLRDFKSDGDLLLPTYSRVSHNPIENSISVKEGRSLLVVEGLWLLFDQGGWEQVLELLDYCFFVDADKELVKDMVLKRHEVGGRTLEEAQTYYANVDAKNFDLVMRTKSKANRVIPSYYDVI